MNIDWAALAQLVQQISKYISKIEINKSHNLMCKQVVK